MRKANVLRFFCSLSVTGLLCAFAAPFAAGQFTQNRNAIHVDASQFPPDIQNGYHLFRKKCNECHGLDTSLKLTLPPSGWAAEVARMQAMPSSQFNDKQAAGIVAFLGYYQGHRAEDRAAAPASLSSAVAAGRKFYFAQSCDACHLIAGQGGTVGPDLTDVGARLSQEKLTKAIQAIRSGKDTGMPALPANTTDEQASDLLSFLLTLKKK